jgi:hypothetical protein
MATDYVVADITRTQPSHRPARCRICQPTANPYRLPIDGAEYARRRRSRRR